MIREYASVLLLLGLVAVSVAGMIGVSHLLSPTRPTRVKSQPYESGMPALGDARDRFSVRFYLVAVLFIIFDIETVFMIPWGVTFKGLGLFGLVEMVVFIAILMVGYVYAWKRGAFEWN